MATIRKRGEKWQAIVRMRGVRASDVFLTKAAANAWATSLEADIITGKYRSDSVEPGKTVGDLLDKYAEEVSPKKSGTRWEQIRIGLLKRCEIVVDGVAVTVESVPLSQFDERHVAAWRDARAKSISGSSINREWNVFSNAFKIAAREWKWITKNHWHEVERPKKNKPRDRLATQAGIERITHSSGYSPDKAPDTIIARVMAAAIFAMQTAMRCKEITQRRWANVHVDRRVVVIPENNEIERTKTGGREVPLSKAAIHLLEQMRGLFDEQVFGLKESQVDAHWRKLTGKALVDNLTFHDLKHYACTNLAKKVSVYDLARIVGTRDLKTLMLYYNKSAADIAADLD